MPHLQLMMSPCFRCSSSSSCALNKLCSLFLNRSERLHSHYLFKKKRNHISSCSLLQIILQAVFPLYREVNYSNINIISPTAAPAGTRYVQVFLSPPFSVFTLSSLYWPAVLGQCSTHWGHMDFCHSVNTVGLKCSWWWLFREKLHNKNK